MKRGLKGVFCFNTAPVFTDNSMKRGLKDWNAVIINYRMYRFLDEKRIESFFPLRELFLNRGYLDEKRIEREATCANRADIELYLDEKRIESD